MNYSLSPFAPENLVSRDGFGSPVPRQPAYLHTQAESDPCGIPPELRGGVHALSVHIMCYECSSTYMCVCVCVFSSHPFWTSSSLDVPAGVTQEEGHTGFLIHLPSAVRALIFVARRIQPFLSLVDREVEFCVLTN